ncbi:hypothetical protein K2P56_02450 [Patescibacteria group bacterium]|nr:hypothetical protein [Patescibacteria group bacterium]
MIYLQPARHKSLRGISLIEAVVYLALATFLVTGVVVASYPLFTNTERQSKSTVQEMEAANVTQKILNILNSATSISAPVVGAQGSSLTTVTPLGTVTVTNTGNEITVNRGSGAIPVHSDRVAMTGLNFSRIAGGVGEPDSLVFVFSANGVPISAVTRYVKN